MAEDITTALAGLTDRVIAYRITRGMDMDRLKEKLKRAAGVAKRATDAIEVAADHLIAREDELTSKRENAFAPHHAMLDSHNRDLDQLEDALNIISNGAPPLDDSEHGSPAVGQPATFQTEVKPEV